MRKSLAIKHLQTLPLASFMPIRVWHGFCSAPQKKVKKVLRGLFACASIWEMKNEVDRLTEQVLLLRNKLTLMKIALERCETVAEVYGDGTASAHVAKHGFDKVKEIANAVLTATKN